MAHLAGPAEESHQGGFECHEPFPEDKNHDKEQGYIFCGLLRVCIRTLVRNSNLLAVPEPHVEMGCCLYDSLAIRTRARLYVWMPKVILDARKWGERMMVPVGGL